MIINYPVKPGFKGNTLDDFGAYHQVKRRVYFFFFKESDDSYRNRILDVARSKS